MVEYSPATGETRVRFPDGVPSTFSMTIFFCFAPSPSTTLWLSHSRLSLPSPPPLHRPGPPPIRFFLHPLLSFFCGHGCPVPGTVGVESLSRFRQRAAGSSASPWSRGACFYVFACVSAGWGVFLVSYMFAHTMGSIAANKHAHTILAVDGMGKPSNKTAFSTCTDVCEF